MDVILEKQSIEAKKKACNRLLTAPFFKNRMIASIHEQNEHGHGQCIRIL